MPPADYRRHLKTTPISPHSSASAAGAAHTFGKTRRPPGEPVAFPKSHPQFVPPPPTNLVNLSLGLDVVLPDQNRAALEAGTLVFQAVGDTGGVHGDDVQKAIATAMDTQISAASDKKPAPAFFYNLGDVVYFNGLSYLYPTQFYEPYQDYHAAIFAIAGNHDGDTHTRPGDPVDKEPSLYGFMRTFCDTASHYDNTYRPTMTQPYVYWTLDAPFTTIIGLYSNVDGNLDARGTSEQQQWLRNQVSSASRDKCLIIAVHHPPYSLDTTHGGYPDIEVAIDGAIEATGRIPDAVLSGHIHSYQRFARVLAKKGIPYVVAGAGGYANKIQLLHKIEKDAHGKSLPNGFQTKHSDLKLMFHNDQEPGFLRISVDGKRKELTLDYFLVPFTGEPSDQPVDTTTVPWG